LILTLELNEGFSVNDVDGALVSVLTTTNRAFVVNGTEVLIDVSVFSGGNPTASISMDAMPREGAVWFRFSAVVKGKNVSLAIDTAEFSICHECGAGAAYFASPLAFLEDGFEVHAYGDESTHTGNENQNLARYMHTGLHEFYDKKENFDATFVSDEVGTCLIIQNNETTTPYASTGGGNITFNFTEADDFFEFELFNVQNGATVFVFGSNDSITSIPVEPAVNGIQNIVVTEPGTKMVTIQFEGPGAVCGIKSCVTGDRPPSSGNNNEPFQTASPTHSPAPSSSPSDSPTLSLSPSSIPSSAPTNCLQKNGGLPSDYIIDQMGSDEPMPEDAVMKISGEHQNVSIAITQLWSQDVNVSFFIQYHSDTHDTVCEGFLDFEYKDKLFPNMECYEGWTDIAFFIYFGDEVSIDECAECKPPDTDENGSIAYYIELDCEPICEPLLTDAPSGAPDPSPPIPPTDCYDQFGILDGDIISRTGDDVDLPANAIRIIDGEHTGVTLEISQYWSNNANISFFVEYVNGQETVCEGTHDFGHDDTLVKELVCYEGWAMFNVVAYLDDKLSPENCDGCKAPASDVENVVAYSFEIPCKPICESAAPSEAPVTASPSVAPTDCFDKYNITEKDLVDQFGTEEPIPQNAMMKTNGEHHSVSVSFTQLWSENVSMSVYFHYHAAGHGSICEGTEDFKYNDTLVKTMECYEGFTDFAFFMYYDDVVISDDCQECSPPDANDENVDVYYLEIDCEPICEDFAPLDASPVAEEPDCYDGTIAVTSYTGGDAMCTFETVPFSVEQYSSTREDITFEFTNTMIYAMYNITLTYDVGTGISENRSLNKLQPNVNYPSQLTAVCHEDIAEIILGISNDDGSSCTFVFQVSCAEENFICGDSDNNRKLKESDVESSKIEFEETPHCAHKDYPCNGDEENMVYVCHYSSRAGYQTFCMPEMDSDVIRFNKNHHCGPCEGWNGVERNGLVD
jgi:hypothetical protein